MSSVSSGLKRSRNRSENSSKLNTENLLFNQMIWFLNLQNLIQKLKVLQNWILKMMFLKNFLFNSKTFLFPKISIPLMKWKINFMMKILIQSINLKIFQLIIQDQLPLIYFLKKKLNLKKLLMVRLMSSGISMDYLNIKLLTLSKQWLCIIKHILLERLVLNLLQTILLLDSLDNWINGGSIIFLNKKEIQLLML